MSNDFAYGIHAVRAVVNTKSCDIQEVWIQKGVHNLHIKQLIELLDEEGITLRFVDRVRLDRKAEGAHQGVMAIIQSAKVYREDDLYTLLDQLQEPPFLLLLDGVTDPHNLGACMRSAYAAGVHAVISPKDKSAPLNATARKVACGAVEKIPFVTVTNLARTMKTLKNRGIWLSGAASESTTTIYQATLTGSIGLVMGAEGKGLRRLTQEHCDTLISIPMVGLISSLNVSVATGICLFEAIRQRQA